MAMQMDFLDDCENLNRNAYWRATQINFAIPESTIRITYLGYKGQPAYSRGKRPLSGGRHDYVITGTAYVAFMASVPQGGTIEAALNIAADTYAVNCKDTDDGTGQMVSFFANATPI